MKEIKPLVCVFDSGIGGISLLYKCIKNLPYADYAYFADNYNMPYGRLNKKELIQRADKIFSEIAKKNPQAAVVACNTVTANCIDYLRDKYRFQIIGIQPAIKVGTKEGTCAILATPATVGSESFKNLIANYGADSTEVIPCPNLATYIEKNIFSLTIEDLQNLLPKTNAQNIVLGCTHYALVENLFEQFYLRRIFDGIDGTVARLCKILGNLVHNVNFAPRIEFIGGNYLKNRDVFKILVKNSSKKYPNEINSHF